MKCEEGWNVKIFLNWIRSLNDGNEEFMANVMLPSKCYVVRISNIWFGNVLLIRHGIPGIASGWIEFAVNIAGGILFSVLKECIYILLNLCI